MKRILVIVGVLLGLGAIGLTAAHADNSGYSTYCTDGGGTYPSTETGIPGTGLSFETGTTGRNTVAVCYSTTPNGSSNPEATGGRIVVFGPDDTGSYRLLCQGDRATSQSATVDCHVFVKPTDPTSAPGSTVTGSAQVGTTGPAPVGQTGAEVDPATTTNSFGGTTAGTGGSAGTGPNTCTWVNGSQSCRGSATIAGVTVYEADVVEVNTPTGGGCIGVNSTCLVQNSGIGVGQSSTDTVEVTDPTGTTRLANLPAHCVQVGASC